MQLFLCIYLKGNLKMKKCAGLQSRVLIVILGEINFCLDSVVSIVFDKNTTLHKYLQSSGRICLPLLKFYSKS